MWIFVSSSGIAYSVQQIEQDNDTTLQEVGLTVEAKQLTSPFSLYCCKLQAEYINVLRYVTEGQELFGDVYECRTWGSTKKVLTLNLKISDIPQKNEVIEIISPDGKIGLVESTSMDDQTNVSCHNKTTWYGKVCVSSHSNSTSYAKVIVSSHNKTTCYVKVVVSSHNKTTCYVKEVVCSHNNTTCYVKEIVSSHSNTTCYEKIVVISLTLKNKTTSYDKVVVSSYNKTACYGKVVVISHSTQKQDYLLLRGSCKFL